MNKNDHQIMTSELLNLYQNINQLKILQKDKPISTGCEFYYKAKNFTDSYSKKFNSHYLVNSRE